MTPPRSEPAKALSAPPSRPKESDRTTRKPALFWDRVRVFVFLMGTFFLLTWGSMSVNEAGFTETLRSQVRNRWWILVLAAFEVLRQVNYVFLEHSPRYFAFWTRLWKRPDRKPILSPWTRYRLGRLMKLLIFLWVLGMIIGAFMVRGDGSKLTPIEAIFLGPALLVQALPQILQFVFIISLGVLQFVAIFWFLSRGGMDTYMPDDIETRFSDVKGQDAVLHRVEENMVFLDDPESIESRGGYVPGGILLWGPPGTGKTLIAQAVAGETAKPFVFVEPGAFINMFMGVGHPQGQGPLPEAPEARHPLRRGHRLLRRGRLAREPRQLAVGRTAAGAANASPAAPSRGNRMQRYRLPRPQAARAVLRCVASPRT